MMSCWPWRTQSLTEGPLVSVPAEKFVVRRIPLSSAGEVKEQVELAIESVAPLPLAQLYWGCLIAPDGLSALVWMAYRRHFSADETADWDEASAVLPGFLHLCRPPEQRPAVLLHNSGIRMQAAVWDELGQLPYALVVRTVEAGAPLEEERFLGELRTRARLDNPKIVRISGPVSIGAVSDRKGVAFRAEDWMATYSWADLSLADIRDRTEQDLIAQQRRRSSLQWSATVAAATVALMAAGLDLSNLVGSWWLKRSEAETLKQSSLVSEIQSTHALGHRLEELAEQRIQFMEMIDLLNEKRPAGLLFARVATAGPRSLEISVRTANADDARQYETALRTMPELSIVRISNLQTRDGHTDFLLLAEFRSEALSSEGGNL